MKALINFVFENGRRVRTPNTVVDVTPITGRSGWYRSISGDLFACRNAYVPEKKRHNVDLVVVR